MRTIESIKENEVVHCPTEEQAIAFCKLALPKDEKIWANYWYSYPETVCFDVNDKGYGDVTYFKEKGYIITDVSEFLPNSEICQLFDLNVQLHQLKESQQILTDLAAIQSRIDRDHYLKGQKITLTDKTE